jgi:hypothetical protein
LDSTFSAASNSGSCSGGEDPFQSTRGERAILRSVPSGSVVTAKKELPVRLHRTWHTGLVGRAGRACRGGAGAGGGAGQLAGTSSSLSARRELPLRGRSTPTATSTSAAPAPATTNHHSDEAELSSSPVTTLGRRSDAGGEAWVAGRCSSG